MQDLSLYLARGRHPGHIHDHDRHIEKILDVVTPEPLSIVKQREAPVHGGHIAMRAISMPPKLTGSATGSAPDPDLRSRNRRGAHLDDGEMEKETGIETEETRVVSTAHIIDTAVVPAAPATAMTMKTVK